MFPVLTPFIRRLAELSSGLKFAQTRDLEPPLKGEDMSEAWHLPTSSLYSRAFVHFQNSLLSFKLFSENSFLKIIRNWMHSLTFSTKLSFGVDHGGPNLDPYLLLFGPAIMPYQKVKWASTLSLILVSILWLIASFWSTIFIRTVHGHLLKCQLCPLDGASYREALYNERNAAWSAIYA